MEAEEKAWRVRLPVLGKSQLARSRDQRDVRRRTSAGRSAAIRRKILKSTSSSTPLSARMSIHFHRSELSSLAAAYSQLWVRRTKGNGSGCESRIEETASATALASLAPRRRSASSRTSGVEAQILS